jgi:alkanesulfonate monooxygenase SsuD/methylene tetrahydromethanopterin reductase-like flavin-dependent oxidoreductase (luciferase family)
MADLKLGINLWSQCASWDEMLETAQHCDALGYEHVWTWDHLYAIVGDPYQPIFEGWSVLAGWAMATERIRIGLMVGANTFRNPGLVAKTVTTLDHISHGRAILGIGGAWFDLEHEAHGIEFGTSPGRRLDWLDESVAAIRTLLDGGTVTSPPDGHYAVRELRHAPPPVQEHLPIMIGGSGRRKTLRTVARYADMWNGFADTPEEAREVVGVFEGHCADVGRDPASVERTSNLWMVIRDSEQEARRVWERQMRHNRESEEIEPDRPIVGSPEQVAERVRAYVEAGFEGAIVELPAPYDTETMERLIGEVKPLVDRG